MYHNKNTFRVYNSPLNGLHGDRPAVQTNFNKESCRVVHTPPIIDTVVTTLKAACRDYKRNFNYIKVKEKERDWL